MNMKWVRQGFYRILSAVLALCLAFGLIPTRVSAEEEYFVQTESGLYLDKTAVLEDDGTYTITMEAYATGIVTTETERKPTDIIIVMDVSGSMVDPDWETSNEETWQIYNGWATTAMSLQDSHGDQFYHNHGGEPYSVQLVKIENFSGNIERFYTSSYSSGYYTLSTVSNRDIIGIRCSYDACDTYYNGKYYYTYRVTVNGETIGLTNLRHYSTGNDIMLTADNFALYRKTSDVTRISAMQAAVNEFIATTAAQNEGVSEEMQHRIALIKYSGNYFPSYEVGNHYHTGDPVEVDDDGTEYYRISTEYGESVVVDGTTYYYNTNCAQILFESDYVNSTTTASMQTAVNSLIAGGPTNAAYGIGLAYKVAKANLENAPGREQIVLFFTDGEPTTETAFSMDVANLTISGSQTLKDTYDAKIYAINMMPAETVTTNMTNYMNYVSSNYPDAASMTEPGSQAATKYYKQVHDMAELNEIFAEISKDTTSTTVELDAASQLRDYMAEGFVFTDNTKVNVETADYQGSGTWADPVENTGVTVEIDSTNNCVSVTGFSYKDNYVIDGSGAIATQGKKLIVTITGVEATDEAVQNQLIPTNLDTSGIYPSSESTEAAGLFPIPQVLLTSKVYVLDYARPASLDPAQWNQTGISHMDGDGMNYFSAAAAQLKLKYGLGEITDGKLKYFPGTMQWNGYDNIYVFGVDKDNTGTNIWSRVSVLPANNVYYEDDFVAESQHVQAGIIYTNGTKPDDLSEEEWNAMKGTWQTTGQSNGSTEDENGAVHGWIDSLDEKAGHSDGIAHIVQSASGQTGSKLPSASFTFTGTGMDIYSYTDSTTGTILVSVKNTATGKSKYYIVDNYAASGSYYQIPTVTFSGNYATYEVKITVTTGAAKEDRFTFYLDGIRVYKPLGDQSDDTITEGYGKEESNAVFTEVRNDLLVSGAVFIDKDTDGTGVVRDYPTYGDYAAYAPEHEVYLAPGETITFKVNGTSENNYFLGLKALSGQAVSAEFSYGTDASGTEVKTSQTIDHTADMYYKVIPNNGIVTIQNTTQCSHTDEAAEETEEAVCTKCILAITKLRQTSAEAANSISLLSMTDDEAITAYTRFRSMPLLAYTPAPDPEETEPEVTESEATEPEATEPEAAEPEETTPPTETDTPQIDIVNPEPAPEGPSQLELLWNLIKMMMGSLRGWFTR